MTPWGLKYAHRLGHNGPGKIMAPCGQMQKVSDTSISSSLSLGRYILLKENAGARRAIGLKACNKKLTLTALQENLVLSSQWSLLEGSLAPKLANILTSVKLLTFKVFNNPTKISYLPSPLPFPTQIGVVFPLNDSA